jgi:hypothetical protein
MIWFRSIEARSHDLIPFSYRRRRRARLASAPSAGDGSTVKGPGHTLACPVGANLQALSHRWPLAYLQRQARHKPCVKVPFPSHLVPAFDFVIPDYFLSSSGFVLWSWVDYGSA